MKCLEGEERGGEKISMDKRMVFSHEDYLRGPYVFACGPLRGRYGKIDSFLYAAS